MPLHANTAKTAHLYRMVMDKHVCPYGLKSKHLLKGQGYKIIDHPLRTREETDAFKAEHNVATTPQTFINGERIGGYTDLREHFGKPLPDKNATSYRPVLAVFAVATGIALSLAYSLYGTVLTSRTAEWFVGFAMAMLAMLKLQDVEKFSSMFLGYDLLAKRFVPYAYAYPYLEGLAAVLMIGHIAPWLSVPIAFIIGSIGAISVIYAVYIQKRDIKCACVGGSANVPLGFISLSENLAMVGMAIWMLGRSPLS